MGCPLPGGSPRGQERPFHSHHPRASAPPLRLRGCLAPARRRKTPAGGAGLRRRLRPLLLLLHHSPPWRGACGCARVSGARGGGGAASAAVGGGLWGGGGEGPARRGRPGPAAVAALPREAPVSSALPQVPPSGTSGRRCGTTWRPAAWPTSRGPCTAASPTSRYGDPAAGLGRFLPLLPQPRGPPGSGAQTGGASPQLPRLSLQPPSVPAGCGCRPRVAELCKTPRCKQQA